MSFSTRFYRRSGIFAVALLTVGALAPQIAGAQGEAAARNLSRLSGLRTDGHKRVNKAAFDAEALPARFGSHLQLGEDKSVSSLAAIRTLKALSLGSQAAPGSARSRRLAARINALTTRLRIGDDAARSKSDFKAQLESGSSGVRRLSSQLNEGGASHNDLGAALRNLHK